MKWCTYSFIRECEYHRNHKDRCRNKSIANHRRCL